MVTCEEGIACLRPLRPQAHPGGADYCEDIPCRNV